MDDALNDSASSRGWARQPRLRQLLPDALSPGARGALTQNPARWEPAPSLLTQVKGPLSPRRVALEKPSQDIWDQEGRRQENSSSSKRLKPNAMF